MKFRFRREWFFLTEKLQITPAERTGVTTMMVVLVVLLSIPSSWFRPEPFDSDYYAPVLAEFRERVERREREQAELLARFYPTPVTSDVSAVPVAANVQANGITVAEEPVPGAPVAAAPVVSTPVAAAHIATMPVSATLAHADTIRPVAGRSRPDTAARSAPPANPESALVVAININTAGVSELVALPGIGPSIAARIVEFREQNGPFRRVEDITGVRGIGEARLNSLRSRITVE